MNVKLLVFCQQVSVEELLERKRHLVPQDLGGKQQYQRVRLGDGRSLGTCSPHLLRCRRQEDVEALLVVERPIAIAVELFHYLVKDLFKALWLQPTIRPHEFLQLLDADLAARLLAHLQVLEQSLWRELIVLGEFSPDMLNVHLVLRYQVEEHLEPEQP